MIKDNYVATKNSEFIMKGKKTLSRQRSSMLRQTQHEVEVNFVAKKLVEKHYMKNVAT